jgi:hypothetical protein
MRCCITIEKRELHSAFEATMFKFELVAGNSEVPPEYLDNSLSIIYSYAMLLVCKSTSEQV